MSRWALVPTKGFERGKSRLAAVLPRAERTMLARDLFEHVITVLRASPTIDAIAVVSDSPEVREIARRRGAVPLADAEASRGLAEVVDRALAELERLGATSVMICMSDLPDLAIEDVTTVSSRMDEADVVLAPDLAQRGTNVVAIKPATALPSCLGHEDSLRRHQKRAQSLGLTVGIELRHGLGFDVDEPSDLERLRTR
jgi:2-phospho-L-lactate guanylyltransferase